MHTKQTVLLELWDELSISHNREKQLSGVTLPIIRFQVDLVPLCVSMPAESHLDLILAIALFKQKEGIEDTFWQ